MMPSSGWSCRRDQGQPGLPPTVELQFFVNPRGSCAFDGRYTPIRGFMFLAHVRHGDVAGRAGGNMSTVCTATRPTWTSWGRGACTSGCSKKMADIHFTPIGGNEFEVTVTRRGVRLVDADDPRRAELPSGRRRADQRGRARSGRGR